MRRLILFLACLAVVLPCQGRTITVDDDGPADFNNIQAAIDDSSDGDTIILQPGRYTGAGNRDIDFRGKAITVRSTDPNEPSTVAATIIDCNGTGRGFYFHSGESENSVLDGVTITNGYADRGGAIYCYGYTSPTIANCIIRNNTAGNGGGLYLGNGTVSGCTISENSATHSGGGVYCADGAVSGCTIIGNSAEGDWMEYEGGGGLYIVDGTVSNCTISGNEGTHSSRVASRKASNAVRSLQNRVAEQTF